LVSLPDSTTAGNGELWPISLSRFSDRVSAFRSIRYLAMSGGHVSTNLWQQAR
jgi:hypothetical protein